MLETEIKNLTQAVTALTAAIVANGAGVPLATAEIVQPDAAVAAANAAAVAAAASPAAGGALTIDDVRKTLGTVIEKHGPECVPQALTAFGVSKLSDLPAESYVALLNQVSQIVGTQVG